MSEPTDLTVYVYPDGENYSEPPSWKSDDYEVRSTDVCDKCNEQLHISYNEPFATCNCGTQEWYKVVGTE